MANWHKSVVARKGKQALAELSRRWASCFARERDYAAYPPVLCNSFPKSGTHLLCQILDALPNITDRNGFWACIPSYSFRERSTAMMLKRMAVLVPGEMVCGHLHYEPDFAKYLHDRQVVQYFIYRDLRDVAISEAHYLAEQSRWHRLHRYYEALPGSDERIALAITGRPRDEDFPYDYPDIAQRFERFRGWLHHHNVKPVRFEDLVGEARDRTVRSIVRFYLDRCPGTHNADKIVEQALENIDPEKSYTFRKGKSGGWRETLTDEHKALIKQAAGPLLVDLGYEDDKDDEDW